MATVELKTDFTQSLDEAINQYRKVRHPLTNGRPEPLLSFGHRALAHFAVSNDLAGLPGPGRLLARWTNVGIGLNHNGRSTGALRARDYGMFHLVSGGGQQVTEVRVEPEVRAIA
ncbi:hypothetical protein GCM10011608_58440 [Micromonospora sonchi]|uniref:Uncharacterized protein n=1 Tax=Micromonospora sonchi TaxID=1763543 RepID=A0A917U832_9ACTN|nr:hypothetical protein [Micromonospora sonchi]GGM65534.1 hypothetical protein GCM10011608_58440 [Micromonospora sonchi]